MLAALPETLLALTENGLTEVENYKDLGSDDPNKASRAERLWNGWTRTWRNRLRAIREDEMPSAEEMEFHPDHKPAMNFVGNMVLLLAKIPEAANYEDAKSELEAVKEQIEIYLTPPPPPPPGEEIDGGGEAEIDTT